MGYDDPAIGNLKKAFNLIDANGNGKLNKDEIRAFLKRTQQKDEATDEQLEALIKEHDASGDGKLSFEEFCAASDSIMPPIDDAFKEAVLALEAKGVVAITADCGFFVQFNKLARSHASIPVMLSSVCQIPQVELIIDKKDKFAIFTANSLSFDKPEMAEIMKQLGSRGEEADYSGEGARSRCIIIGIEDLPGVEAINNGTTEDIPLLGKGLEGKLEAALKEYPNITAVLLECTMMGPYSNRLRKRFKLPVFDCITAADTLLRSIRQHDRLVVSSKTDYTY